VHGPDQLWVADITYVAIAAGFVYVARALVLGPMADKGSLLEAWSRRVVGAAISRRIDAPRVGAARARASALRRPGAGGG
jgi:putative transposase